MLLKGTERNQIPILALTITKPFRLTDAVHRSNYYTYKYLRILYLKLSLKYVSIILFQVVYHP